MPSPIKKKINRRQARIVPLGIVVVPAIEYVMQHWDYIVFKNLVKFPIKSGIGSGTFIRE